MKVSITRMKLLSPSSYSKKHFFPLEGIVYLFPFVHIVSFYIHV